MNRRKFLYFMLIGSIGYSSTKFIFNDEKNLSKISSEQKKLIVNYNNKRLEKIRKNYKNEIKEDFYNNRTIFIGRKIYSYAEFYILNN